MHCMSEPSSIKESRRSSHDAGWVKLQTVRTNSTRPIAGSFDQAEFPKHAILRQDGLTRLCGDG
jgi:hypothetical protein